MPAVASTDHSTGQQVSGEPEMSKETIVDSHRRIIGYVVTADDGSKKVYDQTHRLMGYFRPESNATYDANYRRIGYGDQSFRLLQS